MNNKIRIEDLGLIEYTRAHSLQKKCLEDVCQGGEDRLLICEHPCVLTSGHLGRKENILVSTDQMQQKGIEIFTVDRGGEVTLHSPGQLVMYSILNLKNYGKDLKHYLYKLEHVIIDFLGEFGILAFRVPGKTGAWVWAEAQEKKIASLGIGVKKWVSFHGAAININTDLNLFSMIKPCGLDVQMTSMREIKGRGIDMNMVKARLIKVFCRHFNKEGSLNELCHPAGIR